jgi:hypothetical protein
LLKYSNSAIVGSVIAPHLLVVLDALQGVSTR